MFEKEIKNAEFVEIIIILLSHDLLIVCNPNVCLPIQMQDPAIAKVRSDNIYSPFHRPPPSPRTHTDEKQQHQFMLACRCDLVEGKNVMMVETEWVISNEAVGNYWDA